MWNDGTCAQVKPTCLIGAVGRDPGCFDKCIVEALVRVNPSRRPVIFALSNPMTQAEINAQDAYDWSNGGVIYGSGTAMPPSLVGDRERISSQVNNMYIFPGVSFAAISCKASTIPDSFFLAAAQVHLNIEKSYL